MLMFRSTKVSISELETDCKNFSQAVAGAQDILIVGGGPVGVELAGEARVVTDHSAVDTKYNLYRGDC